MDSISARMLDANANRAREALRVMEDYARFGLNDDVLCGELKAVRHGLAGALRAVGGEEAIFGRDTEGDVGTSVKTEREFARASLGEVVIAAGKRLSEALRVIEEVGKTTDPAAAAVIEKLRYRGYVVEQVLARTVATRGSAARFAHVRLYVLITEKLCRLPWEETLAAVLAGGAGCVQLREKDLPDAELLRRARLVADKCRKAGALSIINDRPDIAQLAGASGVHVGQGDLPCTEVRKIVNSSLIVGVSTENLEQAHQAVRDGASYVGVGPMFPTTTKEKPRLAGPAYAAEAVAALPVPCVAIGGIMAKNVGELTAVGIKSVAVCAAVISDNDPAARCREIIAAMG